MGVIKTVKLLPMKADQHQEASGVMKTVTQWFWARRPAPLRGAGPRAPARSDCFQ